MAISLLRRVPRWPATDLDDVAVRLEATEGDITLIFDVDNTIVRQGSPADEFAAVVNGAIDRFEAHPAVARVIVLSNGAQRGVPRLISRGNKPWTSRRRLGLGRVDNPWIVGDQVMTDGVLAWRLGAPFLHLVVSERTEPAGQARMRRRGRWLVPLLFTRDSLEKPESMG